MAIDFAKTSTSYVDLGADGIGALIAGKSVISIHLWAWADSISTVADTDNVLLRTWYDATDLQIHIGVKDDGLGNNVLYTEVKPGGSDFVLPQNGSNAINTGEWVSLGVVFDIAGDEVRQYRNGAEQTEAETFTATSFSRSSPSDPDAIGANGGDYSDTDMHWDGRIAELAIWDQNLTQDDFRALAKSVGGGTPFGGVSAERIKSTRPLLYLPMLHPAQGSGGTFMKDKYSGLEPTSGGGESLHSTHPPICYYRRHSAAVGVFVAAAAPAANTPWAGAVADKLYLTSGEFTSTLKTSEAVGTVDAIPTGVAWDGTNSPWIGDQADKLYLQSGQFTSTLKTSLAAGDTQPNGISYGAGVSTPWASDNSDKLYWNSGQFTSTVKSSRLTGTTTRGPHWDGTNTPWASWNLGGTSVAKLYLQSGQYTSTVKTSQDMTLTAGETMPFGVSWDGTDTPFIGNTSDKLYLMSGQFTSTLKTSEAVNTIDTNPRGLDVTNRIDAI